MKLQDFESYAQEVFIRDNPQVIKDTFEGEYDRYIADMDYEGWMKLGDKVLALDRKETLKEVQTLRKVLLRK